MPRASKNSTTGRKSVPHEPYRRGNANSSKAPAKKARNIAVSSTPPSPEVETAPPTPRNPTDPTLPTVTAPPIGENPLYTPAELEALLTRHLAQSAPTPSGDNEEIMSLLRGDLPDEVFRLLGILATADRQNPDQQLIQFVKSILPQTFQEQMQQYYRQVLPPRVQDILQLVVREFELNAPVPQIQPPVVAGGGL